MRKIILPTDFSDNSINAINYAKKFFNDLECTFYLVNTYTPAVYNYDFQMNTGGYLGEVSDIIRQHSEKNLKKIQNSFKNKEHRVEIISSFNILTDELKKLCKDTSIDLIIMGTKGATGAKEILFGSNTIHVIKKVNCPILAIPDGYFFEKPSEILFPTDYKIDYSEAQLSLLKDIASNFSSRIHILNVSYGQDPNEEMEKNKKKLQELLVDHKDAYYSVADQEIPQAINEFQKSTYVQLLMMINNKHSFFENLFFKPVIHQIGFHLTIPFLVVPSRM